MMRGILTLMLVAAVFSPSYSQVFEARKILINGDGYTYQLHKPHGFDAEKKYPVVLFLHGAGERGRDGVKQLGVGMGSAIREGHINEEAIFVFPQCPERQWWSDILCEEIASLSLSQTENEFKIDKDRIYLTGVSMGGFGTWFMASKYPNKFAAMAPIAARLTPAYGYEVPYGFVTHGVEKSEVASALSGSIGEIPVWIVHGEKDHIVPVENSRDIYKALKRRGHQVVYEELMGVKHNSWEFAYEDSGLIEWMFGQKKGWEKKHD